MHVTVFAAKPSHSHTCTHTHTLISQEIQTNTIIMRKCGNARLPFILGAVLNSMKSVTSSIIKTPPSCRPACLSACPPFYDANSYSSGSYHINCCLVVAMAAIGRMAAR